MPPQWSGWQYPTKYCPLQELRQAHENHTQTQAQSFLLGCLPDSLVEINGAAFHYMDKLKKAFVGSGIRYDLMSEEYGKQLITNHVSGRLKVAPEHTSSDVLKLMRKPSWEQYERFYRFFERVNAEAGLRQQLIPYFISSHPGCTNQDMQQLAERCRQMHYRPEQVQDFTPTPMTLATTMFYTGLNPYTMQPVYVARTKEEKKKQNSYFFFWKKS